MGPLRQMFDGKVGDLGFGGAVGFAAGFAVKKASKLTILALGCLFLVVQVLAYYDFISIRWDVIENFFETIWFDAGGGEIGERAWLMITQNLPFGGGFAAGFLIGFRMG